MRTPADDDRDQLDFFVNVDNKYLKTVQKNAKKDANLVLLERRFMYANVLIGMALLSAEKPSSRQEADETEDEKHGAIEDRIRRLTAALAPRDSADGRCPVLSHHRGQRFRTDVGLVR